MGLPGAESLTDRTIPTFSRGELPHFAGINTFLKSPYVENVRDVGKYDAAVLGIDQPTAPQPGAAPATSADRLRAALDARQRRLDDARTVERAWRETLEDGRAAFLAQCTNRRDGGQP